MTKTMASLLLSLSFLIPSAAQAQEGEAEPSHEAAEAPAPKAKGRRGKIHSAAPKRPAIPSRQNVDEEDDDNALSDRKYRHGNEELEVDPD